MEIDLFERLPTPWGLLRSGVAPDHQEIKRLDETFDRETLGRGCRFFGNVEVGVDISHAELMQHYTAVIYATGAQTDKSLGIPGEDLPGSWAATEFVAWYNGHPDYARARVRPLVEARGRDRQRQRRGGRHAPADPQHRRARAHRRGRPRARGAAREQHRGGRGPRAARPRAGGLHQLGAARARAHGRRGRAASIPPRRELDPLSQQWLDEEGTFTARKNVELLREFAARPASTGAARRIVLRFLCSPVEIRGDGKVEAVDVGRNEIVRADDGTLRPRAVEGEVETIECGLVLRSVGYRAVPLPDVPFDERSLRAAERPRAGARRRTASRCRACTPSAGSSAVRPGILGTNKRDADETVERLAEDLASGAIAAARASRAARRSRRCSRERKPDLVTADGWRAIDARELRMGEEAERPRVKLASREELLAATSS